MINLAYMGTGSALGIESETTCRRLVTRTIIVFIVIVIVIVIVNAVIVCYVNSMNCLLSCNCC